MMFRSAGSLGIRHISGDQPAWGRETPRDTRTLETTLDVT